MSTIYGVCINNVPDKNTQTTLGPLEHTTALCGEVPLCLKENKRKSRKKRKIKVNT